MDRQERDKVGRERGEKRGRFIGKNCGEFSLIIVVLEEESYNNLVEATS